MNELNKNQEQVFKIVQEFLRNPPVIIWGSGATIPYGLPSMGDLEEHLKRELDGLDENTNLEDALGKIKEPTKIDQIRKLIRAEVLKKDLVCLEKSVRNENCFEAITKMIEKFYNAHPQKIDIVTTNYDRILEYALSKRSYNYTDGFTGKPLSKFSASSFGTRKIINLIKVHGSLNWAAYNDDTFFLPCECKISELKYVMILPSKNKYKDAHEEPYRSLITKADEAIEAAQSFLVIGFGFNDEHLTPKIESKIKQDTPIVIITEKATNSCNSKLRNSSKHCLFEKNNDGTKIILRKHGESQEIGLNKNYWQLNRFMEIF